jgi:hypothetical protein
MAAALRARFYAMAHSGRQSRVTRPAMRPSISRSHTPSISGEFIRMRLSPRISLAMSFAAVALTAACSDSSGPSTADQATAVAARFDSIYFDAVARSDSGSNAFETRTLVASLLEIPAAFGAVPSTITVTTATGTEHWKGYELLELTPPSETADSAFVLLAFRESDAHSVLVAFFDSTGAIDNAGIITDDTVSAQPTGGTAATSLVSVGNECRTPPSTLLNPQFQSPLASSCSLASFRTSLSITFTSASPINAALASLTFAPSAVAGIRIVDPDDSPARRVRSLLRATRFGKRL